MNRYRAYGFDIVSDRPLPLRARQPGGAVRLTIGYADRGPPGLPSGPNRRELVHGAHGWVLRYDNPEGGWMTYDYRADDRRLLVSGSVDWDVLQGPLNGLIFGVMLRTGGESPLHGACLRIDGRAVALLGGSGHGKSTLSAALIALGAELLAEDLLLLLRTERAFAAEPGAPTLHLLPDAFAHMAAQLPFAADPVPANGDGKVRLLLPAEAADPVPLAAVCILEPPAAGKATTLEQLSGPAAIRRLVQQLYGSGWIRPIDASDLAFCARLAASVPIYALSRPWHLAAVSETARLVRKRVLEN